METLALDGMSEAGSMANECETGMEIRSEVSGKREVRWSVGKPLLLITFLYSSPKVVSVLSLFGESKSTAYTPYLK